ncbi:5-amino-6-(5-phosphoribosylamino)uracil reductase [compost metagenome]
MKTEWSGHNKYIELENYDWYLPQNILYQLYLMDVQSIIIEGGAKTLSLFIEANLWDEARVFKSKRTLDGGIKAPQVKGELKEIMKISDDQLEIIVNI